MKIEELTKALNRLKVQTGSLVCLGCGHEHNCGVHGCAILRETVGLIEKQERQMQALKWERDAAVEQAARDKLRWIPVKERLPEIGVRVLTLDKWGHIRDRVYKSYTNGEPYFYPDGLTPERDVRAWMPVPEEE